jgi:hypothetical protein
MNPSHSVMLAAAAHARRWPKSTSLTSRTEPEMAKPRRVTPAKAVLLAISTKTSLSPRRNMSRCMAAGAINSPPAAADRSNDAKYASRSKIYTRVNAA